MCFLPGRAKRSRKGYNMFVSRRLAPFAGGSLECCVTRLYTGGQLKVNNFN